MRSIYEIAQEIQMVESRLKEVRETLLSLEKEKVGLESDLQGLKTEILQTLEGSTLGLAPKRSVQVPKVRKTQKPPVFQEKKELLKKEPPEEERRQARESLVLASLSRGAATAATVRFSIYGASEITDGKNNRDFVRRVLDKLIKVGKVRRNAKDHLLYELVEPVPSEQAAPSRIMEPEALTEVFVPPEGLKPKETRILKMLREVFPGSLTIKQLAEALEGKSTSATNREVIAYLKSLQKKDHVIRNGADGWVLRYVGFGAMNLKYLFDLAVKAEVTYLDDKEKLLLFVRSAAPNISLGQLCELIQGEDTEDDQRVLRVYLDDFEKKGMVVPVDPEKKFWTRVQPKT